MKISEIDFETAKKICSDLMVQMDKNRENIVEQITDKADTADGGEILLPLMLHNILKGISSMCPASQPEITSPVVEMGIGQTALSATRGNEKWEDSRQHAFRKIFAACAVLTFSLGTAPTNALSEENMRTAIAKAIAAMESLGRVAFGEEEFTKSVSDEMKEVAGYRAKAKWM